jgi:hypothetical protein
MTRIQKILAGLLVLQIVVRGVVFWPRPAAGEGGGPLLENFATSDVVAIRIEDQAAEDQVALARGDAGWVLDNGSDYPADETKIIGLLEKLAAMQTNRLVAQTPTSHRRLQVAEDDFVRRIELTLADGKATTLFIGRAPTAQATHVRLAEQDETYLINNLANWEVNATITDWIDSAYVTVDRESVTSLTLENANGTFAFQKEGESWTYSGLPEGETFNETAFNGLLSRVVNLTMTEPLGTAGQPEYGLDESLATVTLTATNTEGEEETYILQVGAQDEEGETIVVKWSDSPYYVRASSFNVQPLIDQLPEDFIQTAAEDTESTPAPSEGTDE